MNPGDLKHRLIFQLPTDGVDEDCYPILEPTVYTRAWGKLKTLKGHTKFVAAQSQMQHHREFTIRYQPILEDDQRPKELELLRSEERRVGKDCRPPGAPTTERQNGRWLQRAA